jgi:hypothetical protein
MNNLETSAIQIVLFLFFAVVFDPILGRKIGEWF